MITVRHVIRAARYRYLCGEYACWVDAVNSVCKDIGPDSLVAIQARRLCAKHAKFLSTSEKVLDAALEEVTPSWQGPGRRADEANPDVPFEL